MARLRYLNFDLSLQRTARGVRAHVLESPGGQAAADVALPPELIEPDALTSLTPTATLSNIDAAKAFGARLFESVFKDEIRGCLRSSLDRIEQRNAGLRLRLRFVDTPDLAMLPWEWLYYTERNLFFALSNRTPVVRFLELAEPHRPLRVTPPLRMLVIVANPSDYESLDTEGEWNNLKQALDPFEQQGLLAIERLDEATLDALQWRLQQADYHILHLIGHGDFDDQAQDGVLILEDHAGRGQRVLCQALGTLLNDHPALRLVVLNTCKGAQGAKRRPFAGTAPCLVQQGVPAVIAMQFEVTDVAAVVFARGFYRALAGGYPVDAALAEARKAIFLYGHGAEWGTPVLFLRTSDGRIFNVATTALDRVINAVADASTQLKKTIEQGRTEHAPLHHPAAFHIEI